MTMIGSWRFWCVVFLLFVVGACAARREAREERRAAKEEKRQERVEAKRQAREERAGRAEAAPAAAKAAAPTTAEEAQERALEAPSKVVFMRATNYGGAIAASVFDVTDPGEPKFVGIVHRHTKLEYPVKTGSYTFMVVSEAADFMQAIVIGGKTYYALITPRMGVWKARFSFKPVRRDELDGKQFAAWNRGTRITRTSASSEKWAQDNAADIANKRDRYFPEWSSKSEAERAAQTLNAEDGR